MSPVIVATDTPAIVDAAARVISDVIDGHIFAAGVTQSVIDLVPQVVPLADDFTEADFPVVTVALGQWSPVLLPTNERLTITLNCAVYRWRAPLAENANALLRHRDDIADAWIARTKGYLTELSVQSMVLMGGPGIVPVNLPNVARGFLSLPFTVEVKCNRIVSPQPA